MSRKPDRFLISKTRLIDFGIKQNTVSNAQKKTDWEVANNILYKMCSDYPKHTNKEVALAKVWIIGRTYAAAIERGAPEAGDEFYETKVGPQVASNLDAIFKPICSVKSVTNNNIAKLMTAYDSTNNLFRAIAGKERRSLSSKYLHFHFPELYYLYDSRALRQITQLTVSVGKHLPGNFKPDSYDPVYTRFFFRCWGLVQSISTAYGVRLTPRQLDNLLLKRDLDQRKAFQIKKGKA